jgi:hypothetical protein
MSNQDESKSKNWFDRFAPLGNSGLLVGFLIGVWFVLGFPVRDEILSFIIVSAISFVGAAIGIGIKSFRINLISWFQQVFKTRLSKVLGSIFAIVFTVEFFLKADTGSYRPKIWEGILSGGWHGAVAVLMVLAGVVLWKLATKDAPKI